MAEPYLSQITMFGGNYAPKKYAFCNGTLMSIQQNQALFALLGTTYGGNGTTNFALPNLQSALPLSWGQSPGGSNYTLGQAGGSQNVTLNQNDVPPHIHFFMASTNPSATTSSYIQNTMVPGTPPSTSATLYMNPTTTPPLPIPHKMDPGACAVTGATQSHPNLMPSLCITFVIATSGAFPSRN
jgi:microcystin-dependent protein